MRTPQDDWTPGEGDVIEIDGHHVGDVRRVAKILEVLGDEERRRYHVQWEDGHESIFYPGDDAFIRPRHAREEAR